MARARSSGSEATSSRDEKRVPARGFATGSGEGLRAVGRQLADERGGARARERLEPENHRLAVVNDRLKQRPLGARLVRAGGDRHGHGQSLEPPAEIGEKTQGCGVRPVGVVDRQQQRPTHRQLGA